MIFKKVILFTLPAILLLSNCSGGGDGSGVLRGATQSAMYRELIGLFQQPATFVSVGAELRVTTRGNFGYSGSITSNDGGAWATGWSVNTKLPRSSITRALLYAGTHSKGSSLHIDMSMPPQLRVYDEDGNRLNPSAPTGGWGNGAYPFNFLPYLNQKVIPVLVYYLTDGRRAYTIYPSIYITTTDDSEV